MKKRVIDELDQYFTSRPVAKRVVELTNSHHDFSKYDIILEPSAGCGSIYDELPENRLGIDIEKNHPDIIESDFLEWYPDDYSPLEGKCPSILTIGNPPYGRQSNLAIQFLNHAAQFSDTIAFIIPRTWMEYRTQKQLDSSFELYTNIILDDWSFIHGEEEHPVRTVFQIWSRKESPKLIDSWHPYLTKADACSMMSVEGRRRTEDVQVDWIVDWEEPDAIIRTWGNSVEANHGSLIRDLDYKGMRHGKHWKDMVKGAWLPIMILNPRAYEIFDKFSYERLIAYHSGGFYFGKRMAEPYYFGASTLNKRSIEREYCTIMSLFT